VSITFLTGEPLPLDLVNTRVRDARRGEVDLLTSERELGTWMALQQDRVELPVGVVELDRVLSLRADLDVLLSAVLDQRTVPDAVLSRMESLAAAALPVLTLGYVDGSLIVERARSGTPTDLLLAQVVDELTVLIEHGHLAKVRRCQGRECRMLFLAQHPRRQWCSPELCGNRARVARHYRRHK
jgi:predicted RNA-binding Zn ribbon-like protein